MIGANSTLPARCALSQGLINVLQTQDVAKYLTNGTDTTVPANTWGYYVEFKADISMFHNNPSMPYAYGVVFEL